MASTRSPNRSSSSSDIVDTTPLLNNSSGSSDETNPSRRFVQRQSLRQAARFLRQASSGRRLMREPSMLVRETAAEQLEERQSDWAYSKPVVVLDIIWNFAFVVVAATVLVLSRNEVPSMPLRLWIVGYALQCVLHMVCVCVEYRRRRRRRRSRPPVFDSAEGGGNLSSRSGEDPRQYVTLAEHLEEEGSGVAKHLESANTMFSFLWWIIGFYWVSADGQALARGSPQLYWLCIIFLGFDVFFVVFCVALACVIGIAVCCCLPCIIALLYAVADQEGATKEDIEQLSKFKFRKMGDNEKLGGDVQGLPGGIMTECGTDSSMEHVLSQEDAIHSQLGNSYFLISDPDLSGSPPRRVPPPTEVNGTTHHATYSSRLDPLIIEDIVASVEEFSLEYGKATCTPFKPVEDGKIPPLGLPSLNAGLSDDDLQKSAYEILLASLVFSGVEVHTIEDRKKEKSSKLLSGLKSKRDKIHQQSQSQSQGGHSELVDTIRIQMQISEAMDVCIRQSLTQLAARRMWGTIDIPHILLGLLNIIFKSDFSNGKYYMQWKRRQACILEELLYFSANLEASERVIVQSSLAKVRNSKEWDSMSPSERAEFLWAMKQVALKFSSLPGKFGVQGETYYWTAVYSLNIQIYEKLLFSVFDVLDEGQLIMESDELLMLIKLTWRTLGITQRLHHAIYGWVLFQQYVGTDEAVLLEYALLELQKVLSAEKGGVEEEHYMDSLVCSRQCNGNEMKLNLVQAIFFSISSWCDSKLQDYHLHYSQKPHNFAKIMELVSAVGLLTAGDSGDSKLIRFSASDESASRKVKTYMERSIDAAYRRVASTVDLESKVVGTHPLALLANELRLIAQREYNLFVPVLRHWCSESGMIAAKRLHQIYGERLKPFLRGVSSLSEDVRSVLPAARLLEHDLTQLHISACEENRPNNHLNEELDHYPIGEVAKPIILDWVIAQNLRILEWTGRVFDLEDWEPLSSQQRQAASVVEVFRIIEETVDQFFGLNLAMDITHLQALLSVIFHSLDAYLQKLLNQLVEKNNLYPLPPPLTRYEETAIPIMKKKLLQRKLLADDVRNKLKELTISKLCVRLNTLEYIQKQIRILEDGIRESWTCTGSLAGQRWAEEEPPEDTVSSLLTGSEAVDELFVSTFNCIRDITGDAISKICDFVGARVVYWDLRDAFLFCLYRGSVEVARLDSVLPHIDTVLNHICGLIDGTLRDFVVLSICRASLEGYVWILLNGGPSRSFSDPDIKFVEDDLNMLKDFFVADGEGLPRSLVLQESKLAEQILSLYTLQTGTLIHMLMTASEQILVGLESLNRRSYNHDELGLEDAQTLVRVLCHKKDREASKFLKRKYQLPTSSEYDDTPEDSDSAFRSPAISDLLKRSSSFHWTTKGQSSFKSFKKKLQEATYDFRNMAW